MNSLNSKTPTKKVWNKFRKVNGNYKPIIIPPLERGRNTLASPDEITDALADCYANISRDPHKKSKSEKKKSSHIINHSQTEN